MKCIKLLLLILSLGFMFSCTNENIELSDYNINLKIGEEKEIEVFYDKKNEIIWESEDTSIAIVNEGKIKAVSDGKTNVLVYIKDNKNISATIEVSVTKNIYNIIYNLDGGKCDELINTFEDDEEVILPLPTKEGYYFVGWFEESSSRLEKVEMVTNRNYNLIAKWERLFNITFHYGLDYNIDKNTQSIQVKENEKVNIPDEVEIKYYKLTGWYTEKQLINEYDFNNEITEDIELFAKYERNQFVINFDADDGIMDSYYLEFNLNEEIALPIPIKDGFEFLGWFENDNKIEFITNKDYNLKAKWSPKIYSIRYNLCGGTCDNLLEDFVYSDDVVLPIPKRDGFKFLGWFESYDREEVTGDNLKAKNYTLTAKWEKEIYKVIYDLDGGTAEGLVTEFSYPNRPSLPEATKEGYIFLGWQSNFTLFETGDKLEYQNYELKAYFEEEYKPYEVFDSVYPLPTNLTFAPKLTNFSYGILEEKNFLNDEIYLNIGFGNFNNLKYKYVKFILNISEEPTINSFEEYTIIYEVNDFDNGWSYQYEYLPIVQHEQQLLNPYAKKFIYKLNNNDFVNDTGYINIIMLISNSEEISDTLSNHEEYRVRQIKYEMDKNNGTITFKKYNYFTN